MVVKLCVIIQDEGLRNARKRRVREDADDSDIDAEWDADASEGSIEYSA